MIKLITTKKLEKVSKKIGRQYVDKHNDCFIAEQENERTEVELLHKIFRKITPITW